MGLGKFLANASRAADKTRKRAFRTVEKTASNVARDVSRTVKNTASDLAVHAGKTIQAGAKTVGKVGVGKLTVANAAKLATHTGIGKYNLAHASDQLHKGIQKISGIPILGSIIGATTGIHVLNAIHNVARGQRVDRAAISVLKNKIRDYKAVAPYAASIVSFIPAVGPGVGAGIAAGAALADGKRWSDIAIEAAKGAIPGGNIAKAVFDATQAAVRGKSLDQIGIAALPVDDKTKAAIGAALALTKDLVAGKRLDQALLNRVDDLTAIAGVKGRAAEAIKSGAMLTRDLASGKRVDRALMARTGDVTKLAGVQGKAGQLLTSGVGAAQQLASGQKVEQVLMSRVDDALKLAGPEIMKAMQVGTAIGTARKMQDTVMKAVSAPAAIDKIANLGDKVIAGNKALAEGLQISKNPAFQKGFAAASGIMQGNKVDESALMAIRKALPVEGKKGYDSALAYFIGKDKIAAHAPGQKNPPPKKIVTGGKVITVPNKKATPAQSFAYFATNGLVGAGDQQKEVIVKRMIDGDSEMRAGAADGIRRVAEDRRLAMSRRERGFWANMKAWVTARGA